LIFWLFDFLIDRLAKLSLASCEFVTILTLNKTTGSDFLKCDKRKQALFVTYSGCIAAIYVALCWLSSLLGLASGAIQFRLSELLCVLACFTTSAIPGLTIGCLISNIFFGNFIDVIIGTIGTLIGAFGTYFLREKNRFVSLLPPVFTNVILIPFVLVYGYSLTEPYWLLALWVLVGELVTCYIGGIILGKSLEKHKRIFEV